MVKSYNSPLFQNNFLSLFKMKLTDDFHMAPEEDLLANIVRESGYCINKNLVYRDVGNYFLSEEKTGEINNFILNGRTTFLKKQGDTCRVCIEFENYERIYYCYEGFYINAFKKVFGERTLNYAFSGNHITRMVLTEKIRFKF